MGSHMQASESGTASKDTVCNRGLTEQNTSASSSTERNMDSGRRLQTMDSFTRDSDSITIGRDTGLTNDRVKADTTETRAAVTGNVHWTESRD